MLIILELSQNPDLSTTQKHKKTMDLVIKDKSDLSGQFEPWNWQCVRRQYLQRSLRYRPMSIEEEHQKVDKSGDIESLRQCLNNFYINITKNAQSAQNKFPLKSHENECSRDNLLCYLALREHDLSDLQLGLAEQGLSSLGRLEGQVMDYSLPT